MKTKAGKNISQKEFKEKGEIAALELENLYLKRQLTLLKIENLIHGWLGLLSHLDKYFIVQEEKNIIERLSALLLEERKN